MATPFGHGLVGIALARRMGVRSPLGLAAAFLAANLPDVDIPLGGILKKDLHRKATHSPNFALTAGMLAGLSGIVAAESVEGERDLMLDGMTGAVVVGSHVLLDAVPYFPDIKLGPRLFDLSLPNWIIDTLTWAVVAYIIWPKGDQPPAALPPEPL